MLFLGWELLSLPSLFNLSRQLLLQSPLLTLIMLGILLVVLPQSVVGLDSASGFAAVLFIGALRFKRLSQPQQHIAKSLRLVISANSWCGC